MNQKDIDKLIEKFFDGETTEVEEIRLKELIQANEGSEQLEVIRDYFEAMEEFAEESLDETFDERLMATLAKGEEKPVLRRLPWRITSVAAAVLILISVWFGRDLIQPKEVYGTIDDPVLAFQETKKVLDEVSKKMNKGLTPAKKTVDKVEENVKKAGEIKKIDKALKKTKSLNKLEKTSDFLKSFNKVYVDYGNS